MAIDKLTIEATIPTTQYGNVKPVVEVSGNTFEDMRDEGLKALKSISDMVAAPGSEMEVRGLSLTKGTSAPLKTLLEKTSEITGVTVFYDEDTHIYTDKNGKRYVSGSKFPKQFYNEFDSEYILKRMKIKHPDLDIPSVRNMWSGQGTSSTSWGNAVHYALENYIKYKDTGETVADGGQNRALSKNPVLRAIVETFIEEFNLDDCESEVFVADDELMLAGTIDLLRFVDRDKKIVRIQDYKTDNDPYRKQYQKSDSPLKGKVPNTLMGEHFIQLSVYAAILQKHGYTVEGIDVFWLNGEKLVSGESPWEVISSDVVDLSSVIK